jgi:hypothetical protein
MKKAGILLIALGIFSVFLAFNMDVVIGTSYNIGLLNERQNIVYLSGVLFLAGIMLFGFGVVAKEESENLKTFALWTFLTPVIFLVAIKIVTNIQEEQARQEAIKAEQAERARQEAIKAEQAERARQEAIKAEQAERAEKKRQDEFVDNKNGTVTHNSTGLTWQKCSVGQTWTGETCSGEATKMTWNDAMELSNSFAGYNDWRLPTKEELMTLVFCSDGEYDADGSCKNITDVPTINSTYFPNTQSDSYWSSSPVANYSSGAWDVDFYGGYSDGHLKSYNFFVFVRLVR